MKPCRLALRQNSLLSARWPVFYNRKNDTMDDVEKAKMDVENADLALATSEAL